MSLSILLQLEEWVFYLSGIGRIPQPMEPASVSSCLSHHSSIIVNFKNPTFEEVVVNIILTGTAVPSYSFMTGKLDYQLKKALKNSTVYHGMVFLKK